jgi:hypothetical protein
MDDQLPVPYQDKRLNPPPKMLLEIASGFEEGWEIADRYGYTTREWEQMNSQDGFQKQVAALRAEMKLSGVTFQRKAAMIAEDLLADLMVMAKNSRNLSDILEVARFAAKMGKLEPVTGERSAGGGGTTFAVQFNFAGAPPQSVQITPDVIRQINADLGGGDETDDGVVRGGGGIG